MLKISRSLAEREEQIDLFHDIDYSKYAEDDFVCIGERKRHCLEKALNGDIFCRICGKVFERRE